MTFYLLILSLTWVTQMACKLLALVVSYVNSADESIDVADTVDIARLDTVTLATEIGGFVMLKTDSIWGSVLFHAGYDLLVIIPILVSL